MQSSWENGQTFNPYSMGNNDGCAEQYICASLYLMSVMSQCYSFIIDRVISEPGHGKEVFDSINDIDKRYIYCVPPPPP